MDVELRLKFEAFNNLFIL